jgi:hypothetical protein
MNLEWGREDGGGIISACSPDKDKDKDDEDDSSHPREGWVREDLAPAAADDTTIKISTVGNSFNGAFILSEMVNEL